MVFVASADNPRTLYEAERPASLAPLLDYEDTAAILKSSPRSVRRRVELGEIPIVRVGRLVRIHPADLSAYIDRQREAVTH